MSDGYFGEEVAATYDEASADMFDAAVVGPAVDLLAELARDGNALEFGIGTGRIALPLAQRGVKVHGIDLSRGMVSRLQAKPGGGAIGVTIGDFAETRIPGEFSLAYLVFNTICNLTTQDAQVACFFNAANHLRPGGSFVIEVGVPALRLLPPGQRVVPFAVGDDQWAYDIYDCATQAMSSNYVDECGRRSIPFRYVWPSELDLMARIAGMVLADRWEDWDRRPFTHESTRHVSVWLKPRASSFDDSLGSKLLQRLG
jgi:SAM-dependent methyltransferase